VGEIGLAGDGRDGRSPRCASVAMKIENIILFEDEGNASLILTAAGRTFPEMA
jgi:hypothetical protein